ncbi:hypothetical protein NC997_25080 [Trichocoleus sp. DQ-A2]|uniref:hypothetical protein n=1 Tax=Cyanophyceae TaxID=3028117 RepID=UPI001687DC85|nr:MULTISPECIES: hypothetical protein [unclassified Coleofasciculus]MBD1840031.1 hypothetical protein [Coleofasciculus sp. FACHB-501]MBD1944234.1 hypothetical protein [Coleofasciculus sp. FACHB-712]
MLIHTNFETQSLPSDSQQPIVVAVYRLAITSSTLRDRLCTTAISTFVNSGDNDRIVLLVQLR